MDSGPRDLSHSDSSRRLPLVHVACKIENRVGHSPTRRKYEIFTRLNRGGHSPINYHIIPLCSATRGAPHGRPRGRYTSRAGHTRPATWPQRHVVTARWTHAPRGLARHVSPAWACRHVSPAWAHLPRQLRGKPSPFFAILKLKILKKINYKIK